MHQGIIHGSNNQQDYQLAFDMQRRFHLASNAPVGSVVVCPTCGIHHKKQLFTVFCGSSQQCEETYNMTVGHRRTGCELKG